jgi:4-amino-4-deoxy-L-arabinose transferase-like glycosyltransferase
VTPAGHIETIATDTDTFSPAAPISLPPRTSHLQITFTALALAGPGRVHFRYRLDGFDHGWVDAGTARHASYANLPPGSYTFSSGRQHDAGRAVWNEPPPRSVSRFEPAIYQTAGSTRLCVLLTAGAIAGAWRLRVQQVRRQFAMVLAEACA